jgi:hypothetical protein
MLAVDTILRSDAADPPFWRVGSGRAGAGVTESGVVVVPFSKRSFDGLDADRGYWIGTTNALRFVRRSAVGDTITVIERSDEPPTEVTPDDIDSAIGDLRTRFGRAIDMDRESIPGTKPYWQYFFVDDSSRLWVQRFEYTTGTATRPAVWEIYDIDAGLLLGRLELPIATFPPPVVRNNRLAGVVRDELGVEYVVLIDLGIPV